MHLLWSLESKKSIVNNPNAAPVVSHRLAGRLSGPLSGPLSGHLFDRLFDRLSSLDTADPAAPDKLHVDHHPLKWPRKPTLHGNGPTAKVPAVFEVWETLLEG